jgi:hypothetical protein
LALRLGYVGLGRKLQDLARTAGGDSGGLGRDQYVDGFGCLRASGVHLTSDLELVRTRGI